MESGGGSCGVESKRMRILDSSLSCLERSLDE